MKQLLILALLTLAACAPEPEVGPPGIDGRDGTDGRDGVDGRDGHDGAPGVDAVLEIIDPCGPEATFDEVILRTSSGALLAYFENGGKRFLVELSPGTYQTTDGTKCVFTVSANGEVTW